MKFVLQLGFSHFRNYMNLAREAERTGWDSLSMPDSLFFPRATASDYPYDDTDAVRGYLEHSEFIEPFVAMASMAAVTTRLRFYPGVLKVPVRQPLVLAKSLTSLAVMSGGRISLGAGLSPWREDFVYNGVDYEKRGEIMDECLEILRNAMSGEFFEFHGKHFDFGPLRMRPAPTKPVPILVGGHSKPALRRAARLGDGWASANVDIDTLQALIAQLNEFRAQYGTLAREDYEIHAVVFGKLTLDDFRRIRELGATHIGLVPWGREVAPDDLAAQLDAVRRFGEEVIDRLD